MTFVICVELFHVFLAFMALLIAQLKKVTGNRVTERGEVTRSKWSPGPESNPGPLQ